MSRNERRALIAAAAAIGLSMTPADAARLVEPTGHAEMRQLVEAHPEIDQAIFPGLSAAPLLMGGKKAGLKVQDVFNTSIYTETGSKVTVTTGIDSGEGSLVWLKSRTSIALHILRDTVRGNTKYLSTNAMSAEGTLGPPNDLDFLSDGYKTITYNSGTAVVGWQFRRAEKFFAIVQYTGNGVSGRSIAHSLGVKPGMIIVKRTDATSDWQVYHQSLAATQYGVLNSSASFASSSSRWNNSEPTSSAFAVGNDATVNASGGTYIAYLFAHDPSPEGLIQCGSYVGNSSSPGPTINLGWKPQYLMLKNASGNGSWYIFDTTRGISSPGSDRYLSANQTAAEGGLEVVNLNSTGFQLADGWSEVNGAGQTYVYLAIREAA